MTERNDEAAETEGAEELDLVRADEGEDDEDFYEDDLDDEEDLLDEDED